MYNKRVVIIITDDIKASVETFAEKWDFQSSRGDLTFNNLGMSSDGNTPATHYGVDTLVETDTPISIPSVPVIDGMTMEQIILYVDTLPQFNNKIWIRWGDPHTIDTLMVELGIQPITTV